MKNNQETEKTKKNSFIEIDFIGKIKETSQIFDLTDENTAKQNNIYNPNIKYGPIVICIGQNDVIPGLDEQLENKEISRTYTFEILPEKAFGKKDPKLLKLVSANIFRQKDIKPFPGLQINFDGMIGTIRTVSGGRVIVDFNHPLSGRTLIYEVRIIRIVTDAKEKLNSILALHIKQPKFELINNQAILHNIPLPLQDFYQKRIIQTIPEIEKVEFLPEEKSAEKSAEKPEEKPKREEEKEGKQSEAKQEIKQEIKQEARQEEKEDKTKKPKEKNQNQRKQSKNISTPKQPLQNN